jgi:hypothetical protein
VGVRVFTKIVGNKTSFCIPTKIEIFTIFASFWPLAFLGLNNHQASAATFKNLNTMVFCNTLIFEYATHPRQDHSSRKLCYLLCEFFAPLLAKTGVNLPKELLRFRYREILTQRLLIYDKETKVNGNIIL